MISSRMEDHLVSNNLHEDHQSAYRNFQSTETAFLEVQSDIIYLSRDQNNVAIFVMLDLSAAFKTFGHITLLQRLEHLFGLKRKPLKWITSYRSNRYGVHWWWTVKACAHEFPCPTRICVWSQVLHNVRKYGLFYMQESTILVHHFYADDSQLYLSFKSTDNGALNREESCLNDIVIWMHENMLELNTDKTEDIFVFASKYKAKFVAIFWLTG